MVNHSFGPFYDENSEILILGSFPSVKSREINFYYGHPQNRFYKVISACFNEEVPTTLEDKKSLLKRHKIALWDVIESCDIIGSSDSSIKNVIYCDIDKIMQEAKIRLILINGKTAYKHYIKAFHYDIPTYVMPSTSPANAKTTLNELIDCYKEKIHTI